MNFWPRLSANVSGQLGQEGTLQRYPVFFPGLRPFFLENASYFAAPFTLLFTRNIIRPDFEMRATGKIGRTNLGILAIDDREPGESVQPGDPQYHSNAEFYVGRVSRVLGKGSNVGLMYTDEEFGGGFNRVGGAISRTTLNYQFTRASTILRSSHPRHRRYRDEADEGCYGCDVLHPFLVFGASLLPLVPTQ